MSLPLLLGLPVDGRGPAARGAAVPSATTATPGAARFADAVREVAPEDDAGRPAAASAPLAEQPGVDAAEESVGAEAVTADAGVVAVMVAGVAAALDAGPDAVAGTGAASTLVPVHPVSVRPDSAPSAPAAGESATEWHGAATGENADATLVIAPRTGPGAAATALPDRTMPAGTTAVEVDAPEAALIGGGTAPAASETPSVAAAPTVGVPVTAAAATGDPLPAPVSPAVPVPADADVTAHPGTAHAGTASPGAASPGAAPLAGPAATTALSGSATASAAVSGHVTAAAPSSGRPPFDPAAAPADVAALQIAAPSAAAAEVRVAAASEPAAASAPRPALLPQLSGPVVALARAADGAHSITLTVSPETLGPVTVRAHIADGSIRLELHAPSDAGRDALKLILADLRRDLAAAAPNATVNVSSQDSPSGSASGSSGSLANSSHGRSGADARPAGHAGSSVPKPDHDPAPSAPVPPLHGGLDVYA